jgi:hypothetical protein
MLLACSGRRARNINVAYRWTHLILINVNLVQQDATIQDISKEAQILPCLEAQCLELEAGTDSLMQPTL